MTLLTVVSNAAAQLSLEAPSVLIGSTTVTAVQLLRHAQAEGKALSRRHFWQALTKEATFLTTAAAAQAGALPADFERVIPETIYNRTQRRRVSGPLSQEEWQALKSAQVDMIYPAYRMRGGEFLMTPTPTAGDTVAFEYLSNCWCASSGGAPQSSWQADTDVALLPEELMTLGVVWRFKQAKGMDYLQDAAIYEARVSDIVLADGGKPRLSTSPAYHDRVPRAPIMPETIIF